MAFNIPFFVITFGYILIVLSSLTWSKRPIVALFRQNIAVRKKTVQVSPKHFRPKKNVIQLKITRSTIHCLTECSLVETCVAVQSVNVNGSCSCLLLSQKSSIRKREGTVYEINKYRNLELTKNDMVMKHFRHSSLKPTSKAKTLSPKRKRITAFNPVRDLRYPRSSADGRSLQNDRVCKNVPRIGKGDRSEILLFGFQSKGLRVKLFALDNVRFVRLSCTLPKHLKFLVVSSKDCVMLYSGWDLKDHGIQSVSLDGTKRKVISSWPAAAAAVDRLHGFVVYSASPVPKAKALQIRRVNLNGSDDRKVQSINSPCQALAIDPNEKLVYYRKTSAIICSMNYLDKYSRPREYYGALTRSSAFLTFVTVNNERSLAWLRVGKKEHGILIFPLKGNRINTILKCREHKFRQICGSHEMIYALCNDWLYVYRNGRNVGKGIGIPEEAKGGVPIWMAVG